MKKLLKNAAIDGILLIVLGIILLVNPQGSLEFICKIIGVILLIMAVVRFVPYAKNPDDRQPSSLIAALALVAIGFILIVKPELFTSISPIVFAVLIAAGAVSSLIRIADKKKLGLPVSPVSVILAVVTIILACGIFWNPSFLTNIFMQVVGVSLLVEGITLLSTAGSMGK